MYVLTYIIRFKVPKSLVEKYVTLQIKRTIMKWAATFRYTPKNLF